MILLQSAHFVAQALDFWWLRIFCCAGEALTLFVWGPKFMWQVCTRFSNFVWSKLQFFDYTTSICHRTCLQMVLHFAKQARFYKKNFRFYHCFGDEDGMKHLKSASVIEMLFFHHPCSSLLAVFSWFFHQLTHFLEPRSGTCSAPSVSV